MFTSSACQENIIQPCLQHIWERIIYHIVYMHCNAMNVYIPVWSLDLEIICSWHSFTKHSLYFLFTDTLLQLCSVSGKWVLQGTQFRLVCDCWKSEKCFEEILLVYNSSVLIWKLFPKYLWHCTILKLPRLTGSSRAHMAIVSTWNRDPEPYLYLVKRF